MEIPKLLSYIKYYALNMYQFKLAEIGMSTIRFGIFSREPKGS